MLAFFGDSAPDALAFAAALPFAALFAADLANAPAFAVPLAFAFAFALGAIADTAAEGDRRTPRAHNRERIYRERGRANVAAGCNFITNAGGTTDIVKSPT